MRIPMVFRHLHVSLIALFATLLVACGDGRHAQVKVYFPEAKTGGGLPEIATKFAFSKYRVPIEPKSALELADKVQRHIYGGVGVYGTFFLEDEYMRFEPSFGAALVAENFKELRIPYTSIREIREQSGPFFQMFNVLETSSGTIRFSVESFNLLENNSSLSEEDLVKRIRTLSAAASEAARRKTMNPSPAGTASGPD